MDGLYAAAESTSIGGLVVPSPHGARTTYAGVERSRLFARSRRREMTCCDASIGMDETHH